MSIATALSSLRKRERAIRTGLLTKGYDVGYPQKYDNDTSAIISVIGGINGRNSARIAAIKAIAGVDDSAILDGGVLDLRGFYNSLSAIRQGAFAERTARKIVFPYLGRHLSVMNEVFQKCDNLTAVTDSFVPATDDFDPADPTALCASLLYPRHNGVIDLSNYAFASCMNLLEAPAFTTVSTMNINGYCFRNCGSLTSLGDNAYNPQNLTNGSFVFNNCSSLTGISFTDFGDSMGNQRMYWNYAFGECVNMVSVYVPYLYGFGSNAFYNCKKLSVIQMHSLESKYYTFLYSTGTNIFNGCTNLLCVDASHLGIGKINNVKANHLTAGNTAKWVFGRSMEPQLTGSWVSNATLHSRIVLVDDPKELRIKYDDGTVFEYSFAQLSDTYLSGPNGITADNWLSAVRDELLAHGPLSNIIELSVSQFFQEVSQNFLNCGSASTKLSAVYFPNAKRVGLKYYPEREGYRHMLIGQRNIKDLLSSFPNLVHCHGMELYGDSYDGINIGGVSLPKAKYVYNFLGAAAAEYYDLPKARLVGGIYDSDHLKYVYAPKAEALVLGGGSTWVRKLSGVSLSDINTLYTTFEKGLDTTYMISALGLNLNELSNIEHTCDYNGDAMFPRTVALETDMAFPKLKIAGTLYAPDKPLCADVLSGVNLNGMQCVDRITIQRLTVDCWLEFPSIQYIHDQIVTNGQLITQNAIYRQTPHTVCLKLPNLLSAEGIVPVFGIIQLTKYPDSQVSVTFDFSGKTAQSADGKIHPPVLTFATYNVGGTNRRYRNALSTFSNMYKSVKFIFDRELSAEVLEDTPSNHWRYNVDGVKWPDSLISCYQFV